MKITIVAEILSVVLTDKSSECIDDPHFKDMELFNDNGFELMTGKHKIRMDTAIQIGCDV